MENQEKPLLRPFEKLFLFLGLVLLVAIFLQAKTGKVWQRTESETITAGLEARAFAAAAEAKNDDLESLASASQNETGTGFSEPNFDEKAADFSQSSELPEAEKSFFKTLRQRHKTTADGNWLDVLKAAHLTYRKVSDVLTIERLSPEKDSATAAEKAYSNFEKTFGVPASESRVFAAEKGRTAADWAFFFLEKTGVTR